MPLSRRLRFSLAGGGVLAAAFAAGPFLAAFVREKRVDHRIEGLQDKIDRHAAHWGLDPLFVASVVRHESSGDPRAVSSANARGLMQITPITLVEVRDRMKSVGQGDLFDPDYNLSVGCAYLAALRQRFVDARLMLAAYHMGPTAVAKLVNRHAGQGPDPVLADPAVGPRTRAYVRVVFEDWQEAVAERTRLNNERAAAREAELRAAPSPAPAPLPSPAPAPASPPSSPPPPRPR